MAQFSNEMMLIIILIMVFVTIDAILLWQWSIESSKFSSCKNNQSLACPTITCNAGPGGSVGDSPGTQCFPYAYRADTDGNTQCNIPLSFSSQAGVTTDNTGS